MRFRGLDLNLLGAFDLLMQERSVSAAARQLHLSQPAMSAALGRLRTYFADDILVTHGKRMYPTPYAEALLPQVRECLQQVELLLSTSSKFDPAKTQRTFRIITSDYIIAALIIPVVERLSREAPKVRLELAAPAEDSSAQIAEGKGDLLITPDFFLKGDHPRDLLFEEEHVVVGWEGNPLMHSPISEKDLLSAGHVGVRIGRERALSFADRQMNTLGKNRRIEVETASFLALPLLLCGTHRLALMQKRLAQRMSENYPIRSCPLPFNFPKMREMMQFHQARERDSGLVWLRSLVMESAQNTMG